MMNKSNSASPNNVRVSYQEFRDSKGNLILVRSPKKANPMKQKEKVISSELEHWNGDRKKSYFDSAFPGKK